MAQRIRNFLSAYFGLFRLREMTREIGPRDYEHRSTHMTKVFSRFIKDESGATAIEYGLIAALIAVALIGSLQLLGGNMGKAFNSIGDAM